MSGIGTLFIGALVLACLPEFVALRLANSGKRLAVASWVLREAATTSNNELMQIAIDQPIGTDTQDAANGLQRFKYVKWLDNYSNRRLICVVALLVLSIQLPYLLWYAISLMFWSSAISTGTNQAQPALVMVAPAMSLIFVVWVALSVTFLGLRTVSVDAEGISWKSGLFTARPNRIAWSEVRSFVKVSFRNRALFGPQTTYILDAGRAMLQWGHDPTWGTAQNEADAKRLAALVAQHTGLPLRDATPLAKDVAKTMGGFNGNHWAKKLTVPQGAPLPPRIAGLAEAFNALTVPRVWFWLLIGLACVPLLVYSLVCVWVVTSP